MPHLDDHSSAAEIIQRQAALIEFLREALAAGLAHVRTIRAAHEEELARLEQRLSDVLDKIQQKKGV